MKALALALLALAVPSFASAALTIRVDVVEKEYYLSGSASGLPEENFMFGNGQIAWDNGQPYDGGYVDILSEEAFTVSGNTSSGSFIMFLHGNGNFNGGFDFETASLTTLTGNSAIRFDYSNWAPALITRFETAAANNEVISVANGASSAFALNIGAVPEPSSATLLLLAGTGLAFIRRRPCRA